jgi:hypothetical protein
LLNSNNNNQISSLIVWMFVSFALNNNLVFIRETYRNHYVNNFIDYFDLLASTSLANGSLVNYLSFTLTLTTSSLCLGIHSRSQLNHPSDNTLPFTLITSVYTRSTLTIASLANSLSFDFNLQNTPIIGLFKCNGLFDYSWLKLSLLLSSLTSGPTSKDMTENIFESTGHSSLSFEPLETVLIVNFSLLRIGKYLVGSIDLFELISITSSIRVMFYG